MASDLVDWLQTSWMPRNTTRAPSTSRGAARSGSATPDTEAVLTDPTLCSCRVRHRLLEVGARRRLLDDYETATEPITETWQQDTVEGVYAAGLETAVRDLALAYAAGPGYRDEWRP